MPLSAFHSAVRAWFEQAFGTPTPPQADAWPAIAAGQDTLIAAPTGAGKTLAAFLAALDDLLRQGLAAPLADRTQVVYVSPLKALSNDIQKNLELPLAGIRDQLLLHGIADVPIRAEVRTGDTPSAVRARMRRHPPHILVTTPESLYLLLTSRSGRDMLASARTLIVDEIHALAATKRGAHLALSLERLQGLCSEPLQRVGLSATQKPIETVARFLTGAERPAATIIDGGHTRTLDLGLEVPGSPLEAVMASEVWAEVYDRLAALIEAHRTTLVFVNTRRMAERIARHLGERVGENAVTSHHGSLARAHRLDAEQRLKSGQLRALVATASLELGIDIGQVDLVCQIGSPRALNAALQRVGRSGHATGLTAKGRLFPTSRDDLAECVALIEAVGRGELDRLEVPDKPLDVLAQQLVAEVSGGERSVDELFRQVRRAWPYRDLTQAELDAVLAMLAAGFSTRRGRRSAWLHFDAVNARVRGRKAARLVALTNGGAIPDQFDYDVVLEPEATVIGSVNEDFAFESLAGDIFQLGNVSYRVLRVSMARVHVEDAQGQPPNIPFWFGEAPGRTRELSQAVAGLRARIGQALEAGGRARAVEAFAGEPGVPVAAAEQLVDYLAAAHAALGALPTADTVIFERFFDEAGDQHVVIHAPFGSRLNRAWGLALRKRFCRKFNFELQAAALEDSIVLSLGSTHSFPLAEVARYLHTESVRDVLVQAVLDAPLFGVRWRWNATIALAVQRNRNGRRVAPQHQRMDAEDLLASVFPDQLACAENLAGRREIPEHPLVQQTLADCLHQAMDIEGLERLLVRLARGEVTAIARDLAGPSPLAEEILGARPYAFLDDAPAEERRTRMVQARRFTAPEDAAALGALDGAAVARVQAEAWPEARDADELHDALMLLGYLVEGEPANAAQRRGWLDMLVADNRATVVAADADRPRLWVCAERLAQVQAIFPQAELEPPIQPAGAAAAFAWTRASALVELLRARLEGLGPVTVVSLADSLGLPVGEIDSALAVLESEGFAMQGRFTPAAEATEWCERGLLARIHRYTLERLRQEIQPVSAACYMRFLLTWQGVDAGDDRKQDAQQADGEEALAAVLGQLEGVEVPAAAWEARILPRRLAQYSADWLDRLCAAGRVRWARLSSAGAGRNGGEGHGRGSGLVRNTPIALVSRAGLRHWRQPREPEELPSGTARAVAETLDAHGALFFDELCEHAAMPRSQVEQGLGELAAAGWASADSFAGLRALLSPARPRGRRRRRAAAHTVEAAGRWALVQRLGQPPPQAARGPSDEAVHYIAEVLLRRYGVVFRQALVREQRLPPWRHLLYAYRRMEARGEARGGRFVSGYTGEQFALPEALGLLRETRRQTEDGRLVAVSAADPLNLVGTLLPGERVPALAANAVLYRDGVPVATLIGGHVHTLVELDTETTRAAHALLLGRRLSEHRDVGVTTQSSRTADRSA